MSDEDRKLSYVARTAVVAAYSYLDGETTAEHFRALLGELQDMLDPADMPPYGCGCPAVPSSKFEAFCPTHMQPFPSEATPAPKKTTA
jgi:hypothetical protein